MSKKKYFLFLIFPFVLSSCSGVKFSEFKNYTIDNDKYELVQGNGYYKPAKLEDNYQALIQDFPYVGTQKFTTIPSIGNQKMLVIPIEFKDSPCSTLPNGCEKTKNQIANSFFGTNSRNSFRSVAAYFNETSFGKLHLSGKVANWFTSNKYTLSDLRANKDLVIDLAIEALEDYKINNDDVLDFDNDKDGFVDGVAFIYSANYETRNSAFWAYQSAANLSPNKNSPTLKTFLWASYQYMNANDVFTSVDGHTYIHETGHLLGLKDYYPQDSTQKCKPLGGMDMMDYNLGDENTFSKLLLNWTRPYVITDETTITIEAAYKKGDCILIPAGSWNGSAMDEYLLLELYSPHGLNEYDSSTQYQYDNEIISLMTKPGVKIFHVDARIAYYMTFNKKPFIGYANEDNIENILKDYDEVGQKYYRNLAHSNTISNSENGNLLIELLDKHGNDYLQQGNIVTNDSLYHSGDVFDNELVFHNGGKLPYKITFENVNDNSAKIIISKR